MNTSKTEYEEQLEICIDAMTTRLMMSNKVIKDNGDEIAAMKVEISRLMSEVSNRNKSACDGDKATAAFNSLFDEAEKHRERADRAEALLSALGLPNASDQLPPQPIHHDNP